MSTTMLPPAPASPTPPVGEAVRYPAVFADLLPEVVVTGRRLRELKRRILIGLAALLVVLLGWYGFAVWQTSSAQGDLSSAQHRSVTLQNKERAFGPLIAAQGQSAAIKAELARLMAGDLQWQPLLAALRGAATNGVSVTSVNATMTPAGPAVKGATAASGGLGVLNETGQQPVGTLLLTGTAPDKNAVAGYIDALTNVPGLAAPFPANVTTAQGRVTFSASVLITSAALGGRYTHPATSTGGH